MTRNPAALDTAQWRALVRAYLLMDLRAGGGLAAPAGTAGSRGAIPYMGLLLMTLIGGALMAVLAAYVSDPLAGATLITTFGAISTAMLLFIEFTALVISPADYAVLGHRPVSSRTYFAARLTTVLVYVSGISVTLALPPALSYGFWRGFGSGAFAGMLGAVTLCNAAATVLVITSYVVLLGFVHPQRLRRATSSLHLAGAMLFYGVMYVALSVSGGSLVEQLSGETAPWLRANPASWFAALVPIGAGTATGADWWAAVAALTLTAACVPIAAGQLSLRYAQRLGELSASSEPVRQRPWRPSFGLPGFGRDEGRAVALLVRAQFRFDQRFRLAVLGIVPLMTFYLMLGLGDGALADPFTQRTGGGGAALHMIVIFLPMILHSSLHLSEAWRAGWIFLVTPASAMRLVVAAKNFVAVFFIGGYVLLLGGIWSYFFERIWHAAVHALVIGLLAHVLLQLAVILQPALPFSTEPRRGDQASSVMGMFLFGGFATAIIMALMPFVYASRMLTAAVLAGLIAGTGALEARLRRRVAGAMATLELR